MRQFTYTIRDELGIHARPAGQLAKNFPDTTATITKEDRNAKLNQLMQLMGLGVKKGNEVTITVEGPAEEDTHAQLLEFFQKNL